MKKSKNEPKRNGGRDNPTGSRQRQNRPSQQDEKRISAPDAQD